MCCNCRRNLQKFGHHATSNIYSFLPSKAGVGTSTIALNASRKIPRVLLTKVSWNSFPGAFDPRFFIDITGRLPLKSQAMKCFEDEYARTGAYWETWSRASAELCGLQAGCEHAEGFEIVKYRA